MEVYFENIWSRKKEAGDAVKNPPKPGKIIDVNKSFEYGGFQWICPKIYLCEAGIVLDLCRKYDASEFKTFYDKWVDKIDALSPEEQEQITRENPMNFLCDLQLYLDGEKPESSGWGGTGWQPYFLEQNGSQSEMFMEEYALSREFGWYIYRAKFSYSKDRYADLLKENDSLSDFFSNASGDSGGASFGNSLERLTLQIAARKEQIYFKEKITSEKDCEPFETTITHPLTGQVHQFFVGACSVESFDKMPAQLKQDMIIPENHCVLVYAVTPELPAEESFIVQDCAPSDSPIPRDKSKGDKAASSIAIIGRADGPTSVFLAGKIGEKSEILEKAKAANADKEVHWKTVCSSLTFEPVKEVTWKCSIQVAPFVPVEIPLTGI